MSDYIDVTYGQCHTCHKKGDKIDRERRDDDYIYGEQFTASVRGMFDTFMLPFPKEEEVFRGTFHDMLFLDSHGVVVKVGPTDVYDLMNPGILQPLTWLQNDNYNLSIEVKETPFCSVFSLPLTVAVYGGVNIFLKEHWFEEINLSNFLKRTGNKAGDMETENVGYINLNGKKNPVLLDSDNFYNGSQYFLSRRRKRLKNELSSQFSKPADIMDVTMQELHSKQSPRRFIKKMKVFYAHQPLRHMFDAASDKFMLRAAWDKCAAVTNSPERDVKIPVWKVHKKIFKPSHFTREEKTIDKLVLKTPWIKSIEEQRSEIIEAEKTALKIAM